nr:UDP-N-acetylglucosamine 2-epimerase (non-hydrolyzing) [Bordetella sp. H567]
MMKKKVVCIVGTRPEAIKMAPVIRAFKECEWANTVVLSTGQHREILTQTLSDFGLQVDLDLNVMQANQSLAGLTGRLFLQLDATLESLAPDLVLAQGDTTTVMVASVVCFYRRIRFGHVEAGLRTGNLEHPFPEEFNRIVTGRIAALHFAPTLISKNNLLTEGITSAQVKITGNTVVDALLDMARRAEAADFGAAGPLILVTAHRRENFGEPLKRICAALRRLHDESPDLTLVYPVHPNPNIKDVVFELLGGLPRIKLIPPMGYREMVGVLKRCTFVITDSGGLQEEAPALGKPVLVIREVTERPEAVVAGVVKIVGTDTEAIVSEALRLLRDQAHYTSMSRGNSPYGDGHASARIVATARAVLLNEPGGATAVADWDLGRTGQNA